MNREQLKALGMTEEQITSVMTEHGKTVNKAKEDLTTAQAERDTLKTQLTERDKDLTALKGKADVSETLKTELTTLQSKYDTDKAEFEVKLKDSQLSSALKLALAGKVHDADLVATLIDKATIELGADGNVTKGLDEQIKTLQESKSFLFVPEGKQSIKGVIPATPGKEKEVNTQGDYGKQIAEERSKGNEGLVEAQKTYFD